MYATMGFIAPEHYKFPGDLPPSLGIRLRAFESELGVQAPGFFWDPLGSAADRDKAAFTRRRFIELKHGRIPMSATLGNITPEVVGKFPGFLSPPAALNDADIHNGLAGISKVPQLGWAQSLLTAG